MEACPIEGRCTECGLTILWGEVLQPSRHRPMWCVEYRPQWFRVPGAALRTLLWSLLPLWFWSQLKMTQPLRPGRLAVYVVLLTLLPLLGFVALQSQAALQVRGMAMTTPNRTTIGRRQRRTIVRMPGGRAVVLPPGAATVNPPLGPVLAEAILTPTASTSGVQAVGMPLGSYPPPRSLHRLLERRRRGVLSFSQLVGRSLSGYLYGLGVYALLPLGFVLLPVSRRRARVRWVHIARITVYGWAIPTLVGVLFFVLVNWAYVFAPIRGPAFALALGVACWVAVPALAFWWAAAIGRYLRMPNAWPVTLALTLVSFLMVLVLLYYLGPTGAALRVIVPLVPTS